MNGTQQSVQDLPQVAAASCIANINLSFNVLLSKIFDEDFNIILLLRVLLQIMLPTGQLTSDFKFVEKEEIPNANPLTRLQLESGMVESRSKVVVLQASSFIVRVNDKLVYTSYSEMVAADGQSWSLGWEDRPGAHPEQNTSIYTSGTPFIPVSDRPSAPPPSPVQPIPGDQPTKDPTRFGDVPTHGSSRIGSNGMKNINNEMSWENEVI